ncbi:hypothetical protein QYR09_09060 [Cellulophaga lytica]|nr:hypothetical protein QYR09_09060 [Cellulophaga lytica]
MKHTIIIFILSISSLSYSQSTKDLDLKNGFKDFKFGELKSKYENKIEPIFNSSDMFLYKGSEPKDLFGWDWHSIYLKFYGNKLGYIQSYWLDNEIIFQNIKDKLIELFGKPTFVAPYSQKFKAGLLEYVEWEGKNVTMTLRRLKSDYKSATPCSDCRIFLTVNSRSLQKQNLKSDF